MTKLELNRATGIKRELGRRTLATRRRREAAVACAQVGGGRNDMLPPLVHQVLAVAMLKAAVRRVRKADAAHVAEVAAAIARLGFSVPVLVGKGDRIVDGHVRVAAARSLGLTEVPCIRVDHLSPAELDLLKIAVNRLGEKGQWDLDALRLDLADLTELEIDFDMTGFSAPEIDIILSLDDEAEATSAAEAEPRLGAGPPVTRPGDLWLLGAHRVLCGDATDPASYERLMAGAPAAAVFTDPPYNIPIAGFVSPKGKHDDFAMGVGEMADGEFCEFLAGTLSHAASACSPGAVLFACMDWRNIHLLVTAAGDAGLRHINTVVWNKGSGGMGGLYRSAFELIAVFSNGAKPAINNVELGRHGRDRINVWSYPGANRQGSSAAALLDDHPTPKPVELVRDALLDVTRRGDTILDPFLGSGTSIVAAERCRRVGYGLELDPRYVDLIVRRWQAETGKAAVLEASGATFEAVVATRGEGSDDQPS